MAGDRLNLWKRVFQLCVFQLLIICRGALFSSDPGLVNHSPVNTVNSFLMSGDTLFAASSGGLQVHNVKSGAAELLSNAKMFPDPDLTALCRDANGNLWIGSQKGYLYKRTPKGQFTVYSNYKIAGWGILCLYTYGELIVVGSAKGVSLFDPQRGIALRNGGAIGDFSDPRVNAVTVFKDTLFLGCEQGTAYLHGLNGVPLKDRNFYDKTIWKTKTSAAPIVSFVNNGNSVSPQPTPSSLFRGGVFTYDDKGWILRNGERLTRLGADTTKTEKIMTMYSEGERRLWIGTDEMYYLSYNGDDNLQQHKIEGLTLRGGTRILAAPNGDVWVLPNMHRSNAAVWYQGIYRYDGRNWHIYNEFTHGRQFGGFDYPMLDAAFGRDGTFWAGSGGMNGNIKHIDPVKNTVGQLVVGSVDFRNVHYTSDGMSEDVWGMVNALAADSSGFLWISVYNHNIGSLICYDPRYLPVSANESNPPTAHYRRFFTEIPLKTLNISQLNVDKNNRIYACDDDGRLTIFTHDGDPLANGIKIAAEYPLFGRASAISTAPDGTTYLSGGNGGLRKLAAKSNVIEAVDGAPSNVTSIAVQENILWLGTPTEGILRYDLNGNENEKQWINESSGLISNNILSLAIDNRNGYLWILTDEGVSRLDAGRAAKVTSSEPVLVFPNVFSVSGNTQGTSSVTFARLEPRSVVSIYAVNGVLVAKVNAQYFTDQEWRASWKPKRALAPGTYIAVVKPSGRKTKILLKP